MERAASASEVEVHPLGVDEIRRSSARPNLGHYGAVMIRRLISLWLVAVAALVSGCGGDDSDPRAEATATVTETVTETITGETPPSSEVSPTAGEEIDGVLSSAGDTVVLGPNDENESVEVALNKVSYPDPKAGDSVPSGRVLVAVEMTITHVSGESVYGTNVYPNFETAGGQAIDDTGWVIAAYGKYGSGEFREELPDTVAPGQFLRGWSLYEIPPGPGSLIFPYGPETFRIALDPPR